MRILTLVLLVCGCGTSITYTTLNRTIARGPRRSPADVDVYLTDPPTEPHVDVGLLEAEQESDLSLDDTRDMLAALRKEAARRGCDAIFIKGVGSNATPALLVTDRSSSVKTITAACIRFTD